jgi:hypothetical protein
MTVLRDIAGIPDLALVIDVDALEHSARAQIDRVMVLALDALSHAGVRVVFAAQRERLRAMRLRSTVPGATYIDMTYAALCGVRGQSSPLIVISDDPALFELIAPGDRGMALGRPELARDNIAAAGDTAVRATLWWLLDERSRAMAA